MEKGKLKKMFCKHDYELIEGNIPIHYPDYEPIQFGQILKCKKCNKEIRFLERLKDKTKGIKTIELKDGGK